MFRFVERWFSQPVSAPMVVMFARTRSSASAERQPQPTASAGKVTSGKDSSISHGALGLPRFPEPRKKKNARRSSHQKIQQTVSDTTSLIVTQLVLQVLCPGHGNVIEVFSYVVVLSALRTSVASFCSLHALFCRIRAKCFCDSLWCFVNHS